MGVYLRNGVYYVRYQFKGEEVRTAIGKNKREAEIAYKNAKLEIALAKASGHEWTGLQKVRQARNPKTFSEAAQDYLDERANYKASTLTSYQSILRAHLLPAFGNCALKEISDSQLKKFQVQLSLKLSASRVNTVMQLLRSILDQCQREGKIDRDPSRAVRRMPEPKVIIDPLSDDELELVLSKIDKHYQPIFYCLAYTGARPNEMQGLKWGDLDWRKEEIHIQRGRVRGQEGLPKTASSQRVIPMLPQVKEALNVVKGRKVVSSTDHVFTNKNGNPIDKHLDRIWARALKAAGIRHRPSYQLRHTFATSCILKGFPLQYVARFLGHSTIDTLIRHYAGWIEGTTKDYDDKLKAAFTENKKSAQKPAQA